jgi:hypothetical protein
VHLYKPVCQPTLSFLLEDEFTFFIFILVLASSSILSSLVNEQGISQPAIATSCQYICSSANPPFLCSMLSKNQRAVRRDEQCIEQ